MNSADDCVRYFYKRWKKSTNMEGNYFANDLVRRHENEINIIPCWIRLLEKMLSTVHLELTKSVYKVSKCQKIIKISFLLFERIWLQHWACEYAFCSTISQFQWSLLRGKMDQKNITWNHLIRTFLLYPEKSSYEISQSIISSDIFLSMNSFNENYLFQMLLWW